VIVNGGNCKWHDVNWVHYVHAAYRRYSRAEGLERLKLQALHQRALSEERAAIPSSRMIIADSDRTRRDVIQLLNAPADRVHTVYYGTDPTLFKPVPGAEKMKRKGELGWSVDQRHVAFIGGVGDRRKGFDRVFDAWKRLCSGNDWKAELVVIGRIDDPDRWSRRTSEAGMSGRIHFLGFRKDVPSILKACDALVSPTRYEAYGLGVHEALCCGLPSIVSAAAGVAERYTDDLRDLLVHDPDDSDEIAQRLVRWNANSSRFQACVLELAHGLRSYTWDDMARDMTTLVERS
jgi:glycosyltransferase involved in cell wall biosynthesis